MLKQDILIVWLESVFQLLLCSCIYLPIIQITIHFPENLHSHIV